MEDTIAAIATPYGEGGIGIIRISGERALPLLESLFEFPGRGGDFESHRMVYGRIVDRGSERIIDECMAVFMKAPRSYTAEDVAEIHCHGSVAALRETLRLVLSSGARLAEPGEFTKRAFLNGRIDLSQAEAVIDVVKARTEKSRRLAIAQLEGSLSEEIRQIRSRLLDLLVNITVNLDYPDEDIEEVTYEEMSEQITSIGDMIEILIASADTGRMIREGLSVAIAGRPNVGKSSLMNALLKESRAIVTEIPGTTRDTIEEALSIRGIPVRLIDTAGIHDTDDRVEALGIRRSRDAFDQADLILLLLDGSEPLTEADRQLMTQIREKTCLVLINKSDMGCRVRPEEVAEILPGAGVIRTAVIRGEGVGEVEERIEAMVYRGQVRQEESLLVSNVRHIELLEEAASDLAQALSMCRRREALDLIEVDVRSAYDAAGEIIGETVSDGIIDEVFARFCLGK